MKLPAPSHTPDPAALLSLAQEKLKDVSHEHIDWDQASVLVQLGLLDASRLPVAGRESAAKVRDPGLPANQLIQRAAGTPKQDVK